MVSFADIEAARARLRDAVYCTPCAHSRSLSTHAGCELYVKLENLQMTGSFKERGACNKLVQLDDAQRGRGIIAASAGNHAQGVAYNASRLGAPCTIVMPVTTPLVKVTATQELGAKVVLHGANYDEAYAEARRLQEESGATFIHPFDDPQVIAGQGTIGLELLEQNPYLEAVVVPIGGGGLASGVAIALKETNPRIKVFGVEALAVPSMRRALDASGPVEVPSAPSIADGIAVKRVGEYTFDLCKRYLDDVIAVEEEAIAQAVLILLEKEKTVAEGAGAAALAGVLGGQLPVAGKRVAVILSGGNIDVNLISRVIDRGLWRSGRLLRIRCTLRDVPGALSELLTVLARQQANVLEIAHDRIGDTVELGQSTVELLVETRGFEHVEEIEAALREEGIGFERGVGAPMAQSRRTQRGP